MKSLKDQLKHRPLVSEKWSETKQIMATHLHGAPPEILFKTRRPLESTNQYALQYRVDNFQPITKSSFTQAVNAIVETVNHIYVDYKGIEDDTLNYIDDYSVRVAGKTFNLKEYVTKYVAKMLESDPNAVLIALPLHPTSEIIPKYTEELPNFNTIPNESVDIQIELISSDFIHSVTDEELIFMAGDWEYAKDKSAPYYWMMTAEETSLIIPYNDGERSYQYKIEPWYANNLENPPFDIVGNNSVYCEEDGEWLRYEESTYSGAVAIGNELLGVKSDEQICVTRFVYPETFMQLERCGHPGCIQNSDPASKYAGLYVNYDAGGDCSTCGSCNGTGMAQPTTSPLGTHWVAKSDLFSDDGRFIPPVQFITPPLESPEFLNKVVNGLYDQMESALFITRQNMTNQSGTSKSFDVKQKVTTLTNATKNVYSILQNLLNSIQGFLGGEESIVISLPPDFNIKSSMDITHELSESRNTSSVYTSELTNELLLKKFGNSDANRRIIDFLELHDKLWGFTMDEIIKAKALYGTDLTVRDQLVHDKGWAVLQGMAKEDDILEISDADLKSRFDAKIDDIMGLEPEREEIADDPLLQLEAEAKSKLKGTVGGVQGIIQINAAVAAGQMTEDSAQALLQEIYGFSQEIADRLIESVVSGPLPTEESPIV